MSLQEIINVLRNTNAKKTKFAFVNFDDEDNTSAYCALGALMCAKEPIKTRKQFYGDGKGSLSYDSSGVLNKYTFLKTSLQYDNGAPIGFDNDSEAFHTVEQMIIRMNDRFDLSFKEIADMLEATFPEDLE